MEIIKHQKPYQYSTPNWTYSNDLATENIQKKKSRKKAGLFEVLRSTLDWTIFF